MIGTMKMPASELSMVDNLWTLLKPLSNDIRRVLALRLLDSVSGESASAMPDLAAGKLEFPRLPKDWTPSKKAYDMVADRLPVDADWDKELDNMWEEWAR